MAVLIFGDLAGAAEIEEMEVDLAIDPNGESMTVLVDECAHQWNAYHVQLPNWGFRAVRALMKNENDV